MKTTNMELNGLMQSDKDTIALENAIEKIKNKKLKEDMRQTHFNYGNTPLSYYSTNKS